MAAGQRGEHAQQNEEMAFFAAIIGIPLLLLGLWHFVGRYIYAYERLGVYWILSLGGYVPTDWPIWGWITRQYLFFRYTAPIDIEFTHDAVRDSLVVNGFILLIVIAIMVRNIRFIGKWHPFSRYGRQMNLYDYMYDQMPLYPHMRLMWKLRLLMRPIDRGLFRMSESVKQYTIRNRIVNLPSKHGEPLIDEAKAKALFVKQIGRLLPEPTGNPALDAANVIKLLDNNEKALLACITPRLAACDEDVPDSVYDEGIKVSEQFSRQYWVGYDSYHPALPTPADDPDNPLNPPPPPVDTSGCDAVLMKYLQVKIVRNCLLEHAYIRTFIYDALAASRRVGRVAPAQFRWLRMLDRTLWLTVSAAGRREPFWEMAGLHAHYLYERKAKKPVERPQVETAVFALADELENRTAFSRKEKELIWSLQPDGMAQKVMSEQVRKLKEKDKEKPAK